MSISAIRSNRGDIYQKLIAFKWALTVLTDPDYQWLEVDSTTHLVDDVVIGKRDGSIICCQCKKNQTDFKSWGISELWDEIDKAIQELAANPDAKILFYSRNNFGDLAKLREFSLGYPDSSDYHANLTSGHRATDSDLATRISAGGTELSTFELLRHTSFIATDDFDQIDSDIRFRLNQIASNSTAAFNALWKHIDQLGGRYDSSDHFASPLHRLTKQDLKEILYQAGAMLAPAMALENVRREFNRTSAIGRFWYREIAGQHIPSPVVKDLLKAIDAKERSVLLTGAPGSGKTCAMLCLQEALEQRAKDRTDLVPLFIQSREFADFETAQDRQEQGLPEQWVEKAARMAEDVHIVVVIDSLDVLSIAREHSVLKYFLAQIDQLLLVPNITVVTACREFDRRYDRRLAVTRWDVELQCMPLNWEGEVVPVLDKLGLDTGTIDTVTRELIRIPRELALFVELAQREGSFCVVTGQALAQRYLDTVVQADPALGPQAVQAIEAIACEMLRARSLSIPQQRFSAPHDILWRLQSLNILLDTHDGNLTFGHQTLLDVLVISSAIREGTSLNEFIQSLPPVPFVRPSIRSFVAQLASKERRDLRKQVRAVLTGNAAFHIRRLVAESFAQQNPHSDDWPLIRDLREKNRDVYQVIYTQASSVEWHHFWLSYLVPALMDSRDIEGLTAHVRRISQWANVDTEGTIKFWHETLSLDWLGHDRIADQIALSLPDLNDENLLLTGPLINLLLKSQKPEHSFLGHVVSRCVSVGAVDDSVLWRYIAGDVTDDDATSHRLNNKLFCQPHNFDKSNGAFLKKRMTDSTKLLDLALEAIEHWSHKKANRYGETRVGYRYGFLGNTSYDDTHSKVDHRHANSERFLLDAIEEAVLYHAKENSDWWRSNRERLCFNHEGALCYFAIRSLTNYPQNNLSTIGRILCDKNLLEFDLSYELGNLIHSAFIFLPYRMQNKVMETVQSIWETPGADEQETLWIQRNRSEYISAIPCHLRSEKGQDILNGYESACGTLIREPSIRKMGGIVIAPFSYEVFLSASDDGVIRLLAHYSGHTRDFNDLMVGGEREVGWQLREASSRNPSRFLKFLKAYWSGIETRFKHDILNGVATYLAYQYGSLNSDVSWKPCVEIDAGVLANQVLDELERHLNFWRLTRPMAKALEACANVVYNTKHSDRLVFLAIPFGYLNEEASVHGDSVDLLTVGINMMTGDVTEALMILFDNIQENGSALPELLIPTLRNLANNEHPAIRALVLRRLPYIQSKYPDLGWDIFELTMQDSKGLWKSAERCLYCSYQNNFEKVSPLLKRIYQEGNNEDTEVWARISALCTLSGHTDISNFLDDLKSLDITEAWKGAASVWTHNGNIRRHRETCLSGIESGLNASNPHAIAVARLVSNLFRESEPSLAIPIGFIQLFFSVFGSDQGDKHGRLFGFDEWLNATSQRDPESALAATEIYLTYLSGAQTYVYDHDSQLVQLVTRLFSEAEEREESDDGKMLRRVVSVQDVMLSLGVSSINEWLEAAERQ
ncbi:ATP-binding protein [Marinimicrobium locisalis]|uniref:ATP-binding protein n=1 Tax=Marinimicrobium locisalis TaxID=546022 RepID=UPI003221FDC1